MKIFIILGNKLKKNDNISSKLKKRLDIFLSEYDNKSYVILSGGKIDSNVSEAVKMKEYLLKNNINENKILLEEKSKETWENIIYSLELIKKKFREKKYEMEFISDNKHLIKVRKILKILNLI